MSAPAGVHARLYSRSNMIEQPGGAAALDTIACTTGIAAVHSSRSPDKTTDNEDAAAIINVDDLRTVLIVADGVGGYAAGDIAAAIAVQTLADSVLSAASAIHDESGLRTAILDGIEQANQAVLALGSGAATTLIIAEIQDTLVRTFHIGDSQALLVGQRGRLKLATLSHSPTGYAVESGIMHPDQAITHEQRHLVSNLVGSADMRIEIGPAVSISARDTLLLATDGLFDNLQIDEIAEDIRTGTLDAAATRAVQHCRRRMAAPNNGHPSKPDDLTVVLYRRTV
jgi:serine/threonine protein phosphatase PrpC